MKNELHPVTGVVETPSSLQQLINTIVENSRSAADRNNTHIINEVGQGMVSGITVQKATAIMNDLLRTIVVNSKDGDIHITAVQYKDVVVLEFQERNNYNGYALAFSIDSIAPDAAAVGGHISIKAPQQKVTTISFSFPCNKAA